VDSNYVFHCVVTWCRFGQPDAAGNYSGPRIPGIQTAGSACGG